MLFEPVVSPTEQLESIIAGLTAEYITLKERNASDEEIASWRDKVRDQYQEKANYYLIQVRNRLGMVNFV